MQRIIHIPIPIQVGEIIETIKEARISDKPIQFIVSKDLNVIEDIVSNSRIVSQADRFITRSSGNRIGSSCLQYSLGFVNKPTDEGWKLDNDSAISKPTLFVLRLIETDKNSADYQNLFRELEKFVMVYSGVVRSQVINSKSQQPQELFPAILKSSILVLCPQVPELPAYISSYSKIIKVKAPEGENFKYLVRHLIKEYDDVDISSQDQQYEDYIKEMERQLRGLSQTKIEQIFAIIKNRMQKVYFDDFGTSDQSNRNIVKKIIQQEKQSFIESSDVLKLVDCDDAQEPAGLSNLVGWLKNQRNKIICYNEEHQKRAASMPKGILMSGIPGSGKSMTAKYVAKTLSLPLLKLDFGDLLDKWQGNSEHRMQAALDTAIEMAPCVLWVDEIEKAFSGANSDNEASSKRMISKFLTWMQDKEKEEACCFVFATANSIIGMPPELFRSGRFDAKFYTFLPSYNDCVAIFKKTLESQNALFSAHNRGKELFNVSRIMNEFENVLISNRILRDPISTDEDDAYTKETSANKFFTGSDITSLIEIAKDICFLSHPEPETSKDESTGQRHIYVYHTASFISALNEALEQTKTYGETNYRDCAEVFSQICYTNFLPASKPILLTDSIYYDESHIKKDSNDMSQRENRVYDLGDKESTLGNEYDKQMYYLIRNSINKNIQQFKMRRERR